MERTRKSSYQTDEKGLTRLTRKFLSKVKVENKSIKTIKESVK